MTTPGPPKLHAAIEERHQKLLNNLAWGQQKPLIQALLDMVADLYDKHGDLAIYAIISRRLDLIDMLKVSARQKEE
jgi:hypothetical protein